MASKDIKTKSKNIEKTPKGKTSAAEPVKEVVRDQFIRERAAESQQEQPERAENYAVDKVEDTVSTVTDTAYRTAKTALSQGNQPKTREAENAVKSPETMSSTPNAPKTKNENVQTETGGPIMAQDKNTPKTKETFVKINTGAAQSRSISEAMGQENLPVNGAGKMPKTKEMVTSAHEAGAPEITPTALPKTRESYQASKNIPEALATAPNRPKTKATVQAAKIKTAPEAALKTAVRSQPKTKEAVLTTNAPEKTPSVENMPKTAPATVPKTKEAVLTPESKSPIAAPKTKETVFDESKEAAANSNAKKAYIRSANAKAMEGRHIADAELPENHSPVIEKSPGIKAKGSAAPFVKTKEVYLSGKELPRQRSAALSEAPVDRLRRKYAEEKFKTEIEARKDATEASPLPVIEVQSTLVQTVTDKTEPQKATSQPDIKTKEVYLAQNNGAPKTRAAEEYRVKYAQKTVRGRNTPEALPKATAPLRAKEEIASTSRALPSTEPPAGNFAPGPKYKYSVTAYFSPEEPRRSLDKIGNPIFIKTKENYIRSQQAAQMRSKAENMVTPPKKKRGILKNVLFPKSKATKSAAEKAEKRLAQKAAKQAARRSAQAARKSAQAAKAATKTTVKVTVKVAQAAVQAVKAVFSAIAAVGGGVAVIVAIAVIVLVAALAASPFGILFSNDVGEGIPLSEIQAECDNELNAQISEIKDDTSYDELDEDGDPADWNEILAVFAVMTAGSDTPEDVVVFDEAKKEKLKAVFWEMNTLTYSTETIPVGEDSSKTVLHITLTAKTAETMAADHGFTEEQKENMRTLIENME